MDDAFAVVRWVARSGAGLGVDTGRIAVAGDSAGAAIAAGAALKCRDEGGPHLFLQILIVPMLRHRVDTPSRRVFGAGDYGITSALLNWYSDQYAPGEAARHPYAAPLAASSLAGLPPAYIHTAELDPLRDDGEAYAKRLEAESVPVTYRMAGALFHGFHFYAGALERAEKEVAAELSEIRGLLHSRRDEGVRT